jgi:chemotaxis protein histidine kinase CheA
MTADPFAERLARVRQRFVTTLESKIESTYCDLPKLAAAGAGGNDAIGEAYRRIHGIVGVGPTVGFAATGKAARTVEDVLVEPHRRGRGLQPREMAALRDALEMLREAAQQELQSVFRSER